MKIGKLDRPKPRVIPRGEPTIYLGVPLSRPTRLLLLREAIVGLSTGMLAEGPELIQILDLEKLASREVTA